MYLNSLNIQNKEKETWKHVQMYNAVSVKHNKTLLFLLLY